MRGTVGQPEILPLAPGADHGPQLARAAEVAAGGGLIAFPTDTVYGLACRADDAPARERLARLKDRPVDQPFQVLIVSMEEAHRLAAPLPRAAEKVMRAFWPGPLTVIVPDRQGDTIGLRVPDHPDVRAILRLLGAPLSATSANRHGQAPVRSADEVRSTFGDGLDLILDGPVPEPPLASTVVELTDRALRVHRAGAVPEAELHEVARPRLLLAAGEDPARAMIGAAVARHILSELAPEVEVVVGSDPLGQTDVELPPAAGRELARLGYPAECAVVVALDASALDRADHVVAFDSRARARLMEALPDDKGRVHLLETRCPPGRRPPDVGLVAGAGYHQAAVHLEEALWKLCRKLFPKTSA